MFQIMRNRLIDKTNHRVETHNPEIYIKKCYIAKSSLGNHMHPRVIILPTLCHKYRHPYFQFIAD